MHYLYISQVFIELPFLPQVDKGNPWFKLEDMTLTEKLVFNSALVLVFWLQHSIMARGWFKDFMNTKVTDNTYHFYQKGVYALLSGIKVYAVLFLT